MCRKIHFISCCPFKCSCCGFDVTFNADLAANGDPMQDTLHMQAWEGMQQGSNLNPISNLRKDFKITVLGGEEQKR